MRLQNPGDLDAISLIAEEGYGELEEYYPETAAGELEPFEEDSYYGRNVIWDGRDGQMVRVDPEYIEHIDGNIFYPDKLAAVVSGIEQSSDRLVFTAPYGEAHLIELQDIKESIIYGDENPDRILTTGDDELDQWLVEGDDYIEHEYYVSPGEEEYEEIRRDLEERLQQAVELEEGDLGQFIYQIRDGNHRAFGALIAGEPFIWMMLSKSQMQEVNDLRNQQRHITALREIIE